jgi:hypothetical protein
MEHTVKNENKSGRRMRREKMLNESVKAVHENMNGKKMKQVPKQE